MRDTAYRTKSREHKGLTITINWYFDIDSGQPWKEHEGHGIVSDWTRRDKAPGERLLHSDGRSKLFYDFAASVAIAKREGWDAKPYKTGTKGEQANRAVEADFTYLKRWCEQSWWWCGYTIEIEGFDYPDGSIWGIESDSMNEIQAEAFDEAVERLDRELEESQKAACSDIVTV